MRRRVVVTGLGVCAPLGFEAVCRGQVAMGPPEGWEVPEVPVRVARVPHDVDAAVRALPGRWRPDRLDPFSRFALLAAQAAREDSGLTEANALEEAAVVIASAMGGERTHYQASYQQTDHKLTGSRLRLSPFTAPKLMPNAASANVGIHLGAHGPNVSPAAACASGAYAVAQAADLIRLGRVQVALAGAAEAPCEEIAARAFLVGDALSPRGCSLPFHRERDGFVLAEGSAVLVLEELEYAKARGARIYAELSGAGLTCDGYHVVAPHPEGRYAARAMELALRDAELSADRVDYVNAHATGTPVGDLAECHAIRSVFGAHAPAVSSTKGAVGHLLGAAGALEAVYTVQAIAGACIPPTAGLTAESIDAECGAGGLDLVPAEARPARVNAAMTNSFAFGGHNAALVFTRFRG